MRKLGLVLRKILRKVWVGILVGVGNALLELAHEPLLDLDKLIARLHCGGSWLVFGGWWVMHHLAIFKTPAASHQPLALWKQSPLHDVAHNVADGDVAFLDARRLRAGHVKHQVANLVDPGFLLAGQADRCCPLFAGDFESRADILAVAAGAKTYEHVALLEAGFSFTREN